MESNINDIFFNNINNIEIIKAKGMHSFPYHTHMSYMIGVVTKGSAEFIINGKKEILKENDCYCVPSNTGISIKPLNDFAYISVCFKKELSTYLNMFKCSFFYLKNDNQIINLLFKLEKKEIDETLFVNEIRKIFNLNNMEEKKEFDYVNEISFYLNEHFDEKFDLDELSNNIHLSKYYLTRLFKKYMGTTPKQYHQQCKIRMLKEMVLDSTQIDIAYNLNFSSQSHMESIFKRYMGMTIKDYQASKKRQ